MDGVRVVSVAVPHGTNNIVGKTVILRNCWIVEHLGEVGSGNASTTVVGKLSIQLLDYWAILPGANALLDKWLAFRKGKVPPMSEIDELLQLHVRDRCAGRFGRSKKLARYGCRWVRCH